MAPTILLAPILLMQATPDDPASTEEMPATDLSADAQSEAEPGPPPASDAEAENNLLVEGEREKITDRRHPDFVRCRSEAVIGSRARRKRTCMTNRDWALVERRGNEASRTFIEDNQPGFQRIPGQN